MCCGYYGDEISFTCNMAERGRPTDYRPEYCDKVIEWGTLGKSKSWMAAQLDVCHQTILRWEAAHLDFSEAMARAEAKAQAHWEDLGHLNIKERDFNSSVWSRSMAARFPKQWREKHAVVGGDEGDNPIKQEVTLDADAFARRISSAAARAAEKSGTGQPE